MVLSDVIAHILRFFTKFDCFALLANYVTVVEGRPIMSVKYFIIVTVFHFTT